jgi:hypothetical protein
MGPTFLSAYYNYIMTNPQKGIWSFYNSRHDQSTMGIDPMNNISNNNKNTLCRYIISTNRRKAFHHLVKGQEKIKGMFDHKAHPRTLQKGDIVLTWGKMREKPRKHGKFDKLCLHPCRIEDHTGVNSFFLGNLDGEKMQFPVNGQTLKMYYPDGI